MWCVCAQAAPTQGYVVQGGAYQGQQGGGYQGQQQAGAGGYQGQAGGFGQAQEYASQPQQGYTAVLAGAYGQAAGAYGGADTGAYGAQAQPGAYQAAGAGFPQSGQAAPTYRPYVSSTPVPANPYAQARQTTSYANLECDFAYLCVLGICPCRSMCAGALIHACCIPRFRLAGVHVPSVPVLVSACVQACWSAGAARPDRPDIS